jgi:SmpA / OmlA family
LPRLLPPKPGVTLDNFRRLHRGMTKEEVDAILGGPVEVSGFNNNKARTRYWHGDHCRVSITSSSFVTLDAADGEIRTDDGRLLLRLAPEPPSLWERLRRLLPW